MVDFIDLSHHGYRIERELGANRFGGRITYLATDIDLGRRVVVKQFQFAQRKARWSEYDSIQREIAVLRNLKHPGIPRYLNSCQTADGFCIIQEYKPAESLSTNRSFSPEAIRVIARKILEILSYLQNRIPPIIHRDLKPDNILVDDSLNVFLVDFGFARVGSGEVGVSSVVKGTLGFMPPEQLFNRQLTEASDLYGLGMTMICLLTHTKTEDIGKLVDISYRIKFKHLVPKLSIHWVKWLEKMVEPRVSDRFPNAQEALKALPSSPLHPPEVRLSHSEMDVQAVHLGQVLSHYLDISNPVPETRLTGELEIHKHPHDPILPNGRHPWIALNPIRFEGNQIRCQINIDAGKLMAGMIYRRTLVLKTNASPQRYLVPLQVRTAAVPIRPAKVSPYPLLLLFIFTLIGVRLLLEMTLPEIQSPELIRIVSFGLSTGALVGLQGAAWTLQNSGAILGSQLTSLAAICCGVPILMGVWLFSDSLFGSWDTILSGLIPGVFAGWLLGLGMGLTIERLSEKPLIKIDAIPLVLLTSFLSICLAVGLVTGFGQPIILMSITVLFLSLGSLLVNAPLNHAKRIADYRKLERNRIRP